MSYFPMNIELMGKQVFLVGNGEQIEEKREKIDGFGAELVQLSHFTEEDVKKAPALVIVGDLPYEEEEKISTLCQENHIPVNVVDVPPLCTFFFSSMIKKGELTVSIATGGHCPGAGVYLKKQISAIIPDRMDEILDWLSEERLKLREKYTLSEYRPLLSAMTKAVMQKGRPLSEEEVAELLTSLTY